MGGCSTGTRQQSSEPVVLDPVKVVPPAANPVPVAPVKPQPAPVVRAVVPQNIPSTNSVVVITPPVPKVIQPSARANIPPRVTERYPLNQAWVPLKDWCEANHFSDFRRVPSAEGAAYEFSVPGGTVQMQSGNPSVNWCGVSLFLGWAPQLISGKTYVAALDIRKNFEPLLGMTPVQPRGAVIVLDAGHGGTDTGTRNVSNGRSEKEFTLDVVLRLQAQLIAQGWTVYLTRSNDVALKLPDREAVADARKADLFLSIHFNSAYPQTGESGLETYCLPARGMPSKLSRGPEEIAQPLPNNQYDAENIVLAERVHRELLKVNGHQDRGVRRARFLGVLKYQSRPAVLVECGYLSNPAEARKIAEPGYRQRMAEAIAAALKSELPTRQVASTPTAASGYASTSPSVSGSSAGSNFPSDNRLAPSPKN